MRNHSDFLPKKSCQFEDNNLEEAVESHDSLTPKREKKTWNSRLWRKQ